VDQGQRYADAVYGAPELWCGANAYRLIRERYRPGGRLPHPLLRDVPVRLDPDLPPDQIITTNQGLMETMAEWGPSLCRVEGAPIAFSEDG
jgi:hypothetical protein